MFTESYVRRVPSRPVSQVLSSQVTNEPGTSNDTAVQLTFRYPVNVSFFMDTNVCNIVNVINFVYYRLAIHSYFVLSGTFLSIEEG